MQCSSPKQQGIPFLLPSTLTRAFMLTSTNPQSPQTHTFTLQAESFRLQEAKKPHDDYITQTTCSQNGEPLRGQNTACKQSLLAERCSQQKAGAHAEGQLHLITAHNSNSENLEECNNYFSLCNLYLIVFSNGT